MPLAFFFPVLPSLVTGSCLTVTSSRLEVTLDHPRMDGTVQLLGALHLSPTSAIGYDHQRGRTNPATLETFILILVPPYPLTLLQDTHKHPMNVIPRAIHSLEKILTPTLMKQTFEVHRQLGLNTTYALMCLHFLGLKRKRLRLVPI